jgi:hypothetical protein
LQYGERITQVTKAIEVHDQQNGAVYPARSKRFHGLRAIFLESLSISVNSPINFPGDVRELAHGRVYRS